MEDDARAALDGPLPEPVRQRLVLLASDTLTVLSPEEVPSGLRVFARWTPARRARLAAGQLAAVLEADAVFRRQVADQLRATAEALLAAVGDGTVPPAADPVEVAAAAYLLRPAGWESMLAAAISALLRTEEATAADREAEEVGRLRERLAEARAAAREDRDRIRAELAAVKQENQTLRKTIRQLRERGRAADEAAERLAEQARQARDEAAAERTRLEAELRRLRARLGDAERAAEAGRRAAREGRDVETVRLRLLVDTLVEAAQGVRRELALPPTELRPADLVDAAEPATRPVAGRGGRDEPGYLAALLALPRVHLVVDGYNVTKTAWPTLPLERQRSRLAAALGDLAARTGAEVTCVFDGADLGAVPPMSAPRGVRVRFSPAGTTADEVIGRLVAAEPGGRRVVVVSTDREVADHATRSGATPVDADALVRHWERG